jgi:hypothetical protein
MYPIRAAAQQYEQNLHYISNSFNFIATDMAGESMKMNRKEWIEDMLFLLINLVESGNMKYQHSGSPRVLTKSPLS